MGIGAFVLEVRQEINIFMEGKNKFSQRDGGLWGVCISFVDINP